MAPRSVLRLGRRLELPLLLGALGVGLATSPGARAIPGSGPHETVDIIATTNRPGASTGFIWTATYHSASNPRDTRPCFAVWLSSYRRGRAKTPPSPGARPAALPTRCLLGPR